MPDAQACVVRLAAAVGVPRVGKSSFDWAAVEGSSGGLRVPDDDKAVVERIPEAKFRKQ